LNLFGVLEFSSYQELMSTNNLHGAENSKGSKNDIHRTLISLSFIFITALQSVRVALDLFTSILVNADISWLIAVLWLIRWRLGLVLLLVCRGVLWYGRGIRNILAGALVWALLGGLLRIILIFRSVSVILRFNVCYILLFYWRIACILIFNLKVEFILKLRYI
jgi:hypothetical protein